MDSPIDKVEYKKHFVAFMDILGYTKLVLNTDQKENATEIIRKIEQMIETCIRKILDERALLVSFSIDYILFSDSLCVFIPMYEGSNSNHENNYTKQELQDIRSENHLRLCSLCRTISLIQLMSLQFGIIYRGAISLDNHYHSKNVIFSKALIEAYHAENEKALYPRVILHESVEEFCMPYIPDTCPNSDLFVGTDDDCLFVDYLRMIVDHLAFLGNDCDYIDWHKKVIEDGITNNLDSNTILEKYAWMMNYHHSRLSTLLGEEYCLDRKLRETVCQKIGFHPIDFIV